MLGQIDFPPFCFQTNHQFLNLIMDESGRQVGWLRKCYLVCIIDNIAADMRSPEPVVSHQSRSHLLSRLWLLAPDFSLIQSRVQSLSRIGLASKYYWSIFQKRCKQRIMIPTLEIPHQPAQRRRSLPRLPDLPSPHQRQRVQSILTFITDKKMRRVSLCYCN